MARDARNNTGKLDCQVDGKKGKFCDLTTALCWLVKTISRNIKFLVNNISNY